MKAVKIIGILVLVYVGVVVIFESLLGYYQPANEQTLVITTANADGISSDRVLARIESEGNLYVAVNHWPRAWYYKALDNPQVQITIDEEKKDYLAVPVEGAEIEQVDNARPLGIGFRILTGFPPRHFVRLDPSSS
ncbi:MAG TPA: DUF385 domain-containing protein [Dehalococcoidia bacterium]|nr:DUF385 domain-containing protein [Dehalococcoidia bacterium]